MNYNNVPGNKFLNKHFFVEKYEDDLTFTNVPGNEFLNKHFQTETNTKNDYKCVENPECMFNIDTLGCSSVKNTCADGQCYYAGPEIGCVSVVNK
jgi:hypothetical protein